MEELKEFKKLVGWKNFQNYLVSTDQAYFGQPYKDSVYKQCHNSCGWALRELKQSPLFYSVEVVHGTFNGADHSWLRLGDYIIDLTIKQFDNTKPEMYIIEAEKAEGYEEHAAYSMNEPYEMMDFLSSVGM